MDKQTDMIQSPALKEDVTFRSLHMSDLSPTSELLLSSFSADQVNYNNHEKVAGLESNSRKAFHLEKLSETVPISPATNHIRTTSCDKYHHVIPANSVDPSRNSLNDSQNWKSSPRLTGLNRSYDDTPSGISDFRAFQHFSDHLLNGDRYGSFISNSKSTSHYGTMHHGLVFSNGESKTFGNGIPYGKNSGEYSSEVHNGEIAIEIKDDVNKREKINVNVSVEGCYKYGELRDAELRDGGLRVGEYIGGSVGMGDRIMDGNNNDQYNLGSIQSNYNMDGKGKTSSGNAPGSSATIGTYPDRDGEFLINGSLNDTLNSDRMWQYDTSTINGAFYENGTLNGDKKSFGSGNGGQKKTMLKNRWKRPTGNHDPVSNGSLNWDGYGDNIGVGWFDRKQSTIETSADQQSPKLPETAQVVLSQSLGAGKPKVTKFAEPLEKFHGTSTKHHDLVSPNDVTIHSYHPYQDCANVQTNVANYYNTIAKFKNEDPLVEKDDDGTVTQQGTTGRRQGARSKSSELPLRENVIIDSKLYGLSKSWSSSKTRDELEVLKKENVSRRERITRMFRDEEENHLKRAEVFVKEKLLRKVFMAWFMKTRNGMMSAEELCKVHLLKKGMIALKCTVEYQRRIVMEFHQQKGKVVLVKCWQLWQNRTREKQRVKMQDIFTQWHYYKLHIEREKLLDIMVTRYILSKNYSKWKARFKAQQKNSIASLHFKINLIYQCWRSWTLYTKERAVKNHMNSIARYRYSERTQVRLFREWKDRTQKSQLCRRIARRRVLLKSFFQWKHWSQYAKIVHLRLRNMCKQYHKKTLMIKTFKKWRQELNMRQSIAVWKKNQQSRALKLWKLRYMRKKIHKHLCKALAKKAKKRRFFQKWTTFIDTQKQTRFAFAKLMQDFYFRNLLNCWYIETKTTATMRKSLYEFRHKINARNLKHSLDWWKFQMKIVELKKRSRNNWSVRCVRQCYVVWKSKVRKVKLVSKLQQNRPIWKRLVVKRFFRLWQEEQEKIKVDQKRSMYVASILRRNCLTRVFQAWRVVNQEECIIAFTVQRRERKEMARVYDVWCCYVTRTKLARELREIKSKLMKQTTLEIWRYKLWSVTKEQEVVMTLRYFKLQRYFMAWIDHVKNIRLAEKLRAQKLETITKKYGQKWKTFTEEKIEEREKKIAEKACRGILLVSFFTFWKRKTKDQTEKMKGMEDVASKTYERQLTENILQRWIRQYTVEVKIREYLNVKRMEVLQEAFVAWREFVNEEFEQQVCDFTANLMLDSSLSTSGYQTSMKTSGASFQYIPADTESYPASSSPRSRPVTPNRSSDDSSEKLASKSHSIFRPITMERPNPGPLSQTPPPSISAYQRAQLNRQISVDQSSHTESSQTRSSEDDGVPSSGVHSAGEESDQDDRMSINIPESDYSFQASECGTPRDRELLIADTIVHWRSLSLSVAFRSWCKYTKHMNLLREMFSDCVVKKRDKLLTEMLGKWRRRLYVTVLARQHWLRQMKKKYLVVWVSYRQLEIVNARNKDQSQLFIKTVLLKRFFMKWKNKKTAKTQLQSIVGKWQKKAVVTDTDKVIIQKFQQKEEVIYIKQAFFYWKQATRRQQQASNFCKKLLLRRYLCGWNGIACYQAEVTKKMKTFRNTNLMTKMFKEWLLRYEDNHTAKIILGVADERKIAKTFRAWREWSKLTSCHKKISLSFFRTKERHKLKTKFNFWLTESKKRILTREHFNKQLQRRVLISWKNVLTIKASTTRSVQDFKETFQRNKLRVWFDLWCKRSQHCQRLSDYLKQRTQQKLRRTFEFWKQRKRKREAIEHFSHKLKKKTLANWCQEIAKRKKARQHFKTWHTIAEGTKERNQVADNLIQDSEQKLLKKTFYFWKDKTRHIQVAKYHHTTKLGRRFFLAWQEYTGSRKNLCSSLTQFQLSHQKDNIGLLEKYMKIWKMKSTFSTKADEIFFQKISSKYWKIWRHNFVRRKVSTAMVDHDSKKILSRVFISWYHITTSQNQLKKEVHTLLLKKWFRHWMARYNDT